MPKSKQFFNFPNVLPYQQVFWLFLIMTLVFYFPTREAGFVTDVTGGIERIQNQPFQNLLISFDFPALNQISVALFYVWYKIFGLSGFVWYVLFTILHALNATLAYRFCCQLLAQFSISSYGKLSFFAALLFLIHPYQTEVLVWRACLNYLLVTTFTLSSLIQLFLYLSTTNLRHLYALHFFFGLALFSFELSLVIPALTLISYTIWSWQQQKTALLPRFFLKISVPQIIGISLYFILNKLIFGAWIGHYGAATHLKFSLSEMVGTWWMYFAKHFFFVRFFPHHYKELIFNFCGQYGLWLFCLFITLGLAFLYFYSKKQLLKKGKIRLILVLSSLAVLALFPVLNLYFYFLQWIENDRYGYLFSVFGMMLLVLLISQFPKIIARFLLGIYMFFSVYFLVQTNQIWKESATVFYSLLKDYRWQDAENVVILNVPDNYNGAYMFRIIGKGSGFKDALTHIYQQKIKGTIWEVTQYNMVKPTDGVSVETMQPNQLKITFNQWGNWFWRNGVGVGDTHKRTLYTAHFKGQYYLLDLKDLPPNTVFIYQDGKHWKEWTLANN